MGLDFLILGTAEGETHDANDLYNVSVKRHPNALYKIFSVSR
jgi:hypothetical protein